LITDNKTPDGYKKTPLGLIPSEWKLRPLKELADITGGYAFKSKEMKTIEGKYQVIRMSNVYQGLLALNRSPVYLDSINEKEKKFLLRTDDIIMSLTGTIGKRDYGFSIKIITDGNLLLNQRLCKFVANEKTDSTYLNYALKSERFLFGFFLLGRGGTGNQANVGTNDLKELEILAPPLKEQHVIGSVLLNWDQAIFTTQKLIDELKLRNKGLAQQLLTGKKRIKGFEGQWKNYHYSDILKKVKRPVEWNDETLYNLISVRRRSGGIFYRDALYGHQIKVKNLNIAKTGDFLFSKMQIVHGASALVTPEFDEAKISGSYISVRATDESILSMEFFNWYSKLPKFYHQTFISSYGVHIEKMTFDFKLFLTETIHLPSLDEQQAIISILEQADKELRLHQQQLDTLNEQKKGLMQKLLTGEIRVKTDKTN